MKVLVNLTCFMEQQLYEDKHALSCYGEWLLTHLSKHIEQGLKYKILKIVVGLHEEANRPHYHMFILYDTKDGKIYKTLNEKIQRVVSTVIFSQKYKEQKYNISFIYEGESKKYKKKITVYDESAMRYPLKENNSYCFFYGLGDEEIKSFKSLSNQEWKLLKQKLLTQETKQNIKSDQKQKLTDFVVQILKNELGFENQDIKSKIKFTMKQIIEYSVENEINFNINQMKNQAINILRHNQLITTEEIVDLIYLG